MKSLSIVLVSFALICSSVSANDHTDSEVRKMVEDLNEIRPALKNTPDELNDFVKSTNLIEKLKPYTKAGFMTPEILFEDGKKILDRNKMYFGLVEKKSWAIRDLRITENMVRDMVTRLEGVLSKLESKNSKTGVEKIEKQLDILNALATMLSRNMKVDKERLDAYMKRANEVYFDSLETLRSKLV